IALAWARPNTNRPGAGCSSLNSLASSAPWTRFDFHAVTITSIRPGPGTFTDRTNEPSLWALYRGGSTKWLLGRIETGWAPPVLTIPVPICWLAIGPVPPPVSGLTADGGWLPFPAWWASMTKTPAAVNETAAPESEHTPVPLEG